MGKRYRHGERALTLRREDFAPLCRSRSVFLPVCCFAKAYAQGLRSACNYDATSRSNMQVTIRLRLASGATTVAPGIERGEVGSVEETDHATTE